MEIFVILLKKNKFCGQSYKKMMRYSNFAELFENN